MKVKELIENLNKYNQNAKVLLIVPRDVDVCGDFTVDDKDLPDVGCINVYLDGRPKQ